MKLKSHESEWIGAISFGALMLIMVSAIVL